MIYPIEEDGFDRKLVASDWRYSAAAVGMVRYFDYHGMKYFPSEDALLYRSEDIALSKDKEYYEFVEYFFRSEMHHCEVEDLLENPELTPGQEKIVNGKLAANTIMKKTLKGLKYSPETKEEILRCIDENRQELTKETFGEKPFKNKSFSNFGYNLGYGKFANYNRLRKEVDKICRLKGFYADNNNYRKTRGISYNFDFSNFNGKDALEFDFIPFAFTKAFEGIFVNNNFNMKDLILTNEAVHREIEDLKKREFELQKRKLKEKKDEDFIFSQKDAEFRNLLFLSMKKGAHFIDYDVEIIVKERDEEYYKTMLVRREAIRIFEILRSLEKDKSEEEKNLYKALSRWYRLPNGEYVKMMKPVIENILNQVHLDGLIETLLKDGSSHGFTIGQLIRVNYILYKGEDYVNDLSMKGAFGVSKAVVEKLIGQKAENKIPSYRHKLISCLVFKNYERFIEILLQLSSYTQIPMGFLYELAEDFESNKNVAYTFVNGLENFKRTEKEGGENNE